MTQTSVKPMSPSAFAHSVDLPPAPHVRKIFWPRAASAGSRRGSLVSALISSSPRVMLRAPGIVPCWAISHASRTSISIAAPRSMIGFASCGLMTLIWPRASLTSCRNVLAMSPYRAEMGQAFARNLLGCRREVEGLDREPARVLRLRERVADGLELERAHAGAAPVGIVD